MIKGLLNRRKSNEVSEAPEVDDEGFDITTARLPGRSIIAFQKRGGQATALEVTERGTEILQGLAAGVILSELEEVQNAAEDLAVYPLAEGGSASRAEAEAFIQSLDLLDGTEKQALLGALPR